MDGQDGGLVDAQSAISLTVLGTQVLHKSFGCIQGCKFCMGSPAKKEGAIKNM